MNKRFFRNYLVVSWWDYYCENGHPPKNSLQIQCNHYQTSNAILHRNWKNNLKVHMEAQKT